MAAIDTAARFERALVKFLDNFCDIETGFEPWIHCGEINATSHYAEQQLQFRLLKTDVGIEINYVLVDRRA